MNTRSLKLIRDVIINSGKWTSIEMAQDSIYLEFKDVELGTPKSNDEMSLTVRFAEDSFFTVFYNDIWDIDFLSKYNYKHQLLSEEVLFDVQDIKFIDFEYLNTFFYNYKSEKTVSVVEDFDIHNIRNDFFMLVETKEIAFAVGANQMDFFSPFELNFSVGMDYNIEAFNKKLTGSLHIAPLAHNFKHVSRLDLATRYGIPEGHHGMNDWGSQFTANITWIPTDKIKWGTRLYAYTTYSRAVVEWENTFSFAFSRYISAQVFLYPRFDDGVQKMPNHSYWQIKEYLSLGFSYSM